ncbi:hypothetical protein CR513_06808, partial [Mucuna pruriens]
MEGKEVMMASRRVVMRVLFRKMLESFQGIFLKDTPRGLPSIKGIEHHTDFILGATLPNGATHRANPEEIEHRANTKQRD